MKILVTGVAGQLGHDVMNEIYNRNINGIGSDIAEVYSGIKDGSSVTVMPYVQMDITQSEIVEKIISAMNPDVVMHCAAWTAVDAAENDENRDKVFKINVDGTRNIAYVCKKLGCKLVYISTDYVFNGQGTVPWKPDCKDYAPLNFYGETKLAGELAVAEALKKYFIVRIAWVFGLNGKNFVKTMLNVGKKILDAGNTQPIRVVDDQIGTPTYTYDVARLLVDMVQTEKYGYYHATNEGGFISWYEFACAIFKEAGALGNSEFLKLNVVPVSTAEYGISKAARPFNSRLDKSKLIENGFTPLPDWQDALHRYLKEIL